MAEAKSVEEPQFIETSKYNVPYVAYGTPNNDPSLVLLHGISVPETHWGKLPEELANLGHHVLAVGVPSYKQPSWAVNLQQISDYSTKATCEIMSGNILSGLNESLKIMRHHAFLPTLGSYAEDQKVAIHELTGYKPYNLLGLSFGGLLAQQHGLDDKDNINKLVLAGTLPATLVPMVETPDHKAVSAIWSHNRTSKEISAIYGEETGNNPEVYEDLQAIIHRDIDPINHANQLTAVMLSIGALVTRRMLQKLVEGNAPETLVMAGTEDKIMPYKTVKLATKILGLELVTIPGGGHGFLLSDPFKMAGIISNFLKPNKVTNKSETVLPAPLRSVV